jgi:hypothetical protein
MTTTLTLPVRTGQPSTGSKRSAAVAGALAMLIAVSFLIANVTTHRSATVTSFTKISTADAAQLAADVAPVTVRMTAANTAQVAADVAPVTVRMTAANTAQVAADVAPVTTKLSAADSAQITR